MVPGNLRMEGAGVLTSAMRNFEPMFEEARASSPVHYAKALMRRAFCHRVGVLTLLPAKKVQPRQRRKTAAHGVSRGSQSFIG